MVGPAGFGKPRPKNSPLDCFYPAGRGTPGTGCSNSAYVLPPPFITNKKMQPLRGCILVGPAGFEPTQWRSQSPLHNAYFLSTSRYLFFQGRSFSRSYDSICQKSFSCNLPNVTFYKVLSTGYALLKHTSQHDLFGHHRTCAYLCQKEEFSHPS